MDHREMQRLARDPDAVRRTAALIRALIPEALTDTSRDFLARLETYDGAPPLSIRQLELLESLREQSWRRATASGYRAGRLVAQCWERRLDLDDEAAVAWLEDAHALGLDAALSRPQWRQLIALCKELGVLDPQTWIEL